MAATAAAAAVAIAAATTNFELARMFMLPFSCREHFSSPSPGFIGTAGHYSIRLRGGMAFYYTQGFLWNIFGHRGTFLEVN